MGREGITTIQVYPETRDLLKGVGFKEETYDDIIRRLVESHRKHSKK